MYNNITFFINLFISSKRVTTWGVPRCVLTLLWRKTCFILLHVILTSYCTILSNYYYNFQENILKYQQIKIADQLAALLKNSIQGRNLDANQILAFVTSMKDEEFKLTGEMLSSINISAINVGRSKVYSPYMLQMSSSPQEKAETFIQVWSVDFS